MIKMENGRMEREEWNTINWVEREYDGLKHTEAGIHDCVFNHAGVWDYLNTEFSKSKRRGKRDEVE